MKLYQVWFRESEFTPTVVLFGTFDTHDGASRRARFVALDVVPYV